MRIEPLSVADLGPKAIDRTGSTVGRLVVIGLEGAIRTKRARRLVWRCRCDCGAEITVSGFHLSSGRQRSCGCLRSELTAQKNTTHSMSHSRTYGTWRSMIERCSNPKSISYRYYGARGITVCAEWLGVGGFDRFFADMGVRPRKKTLDRKDPNGHYEPSNCKWSTATEQAKNRRKKKPV